MLGSGIPLTEVEAFDSLRGTEPSLSTSVLPTRGSSGSRSSSSSVGSATHHVSSAASVTLCLCVFLRPPRAEAWSGGGPPRQPLTDRGLGRHLRIRAEYSRLQSLLLLGQYKGWSSRWSSTTGLEGRTSDIGLSNHEQGIRVAFDRCHHHRRRRVLSTMDSTPFMTRSEANNDGGVCGGVRGAVEGAATFSSSSAVVATAASFPSSSPSTDDRINNSNNGAPLSNSAAAAVPPPLTAEEAAAGAKSTMLTSSDHTSDGNIASPSPAYVRVAANHDYSHASRRPPSELSSARGAVTMWEKTPEERQIKDLGKVGRWRQALAILEGLESPTEGQYIAAIIACEVSRQPRQSLRIHSSMVSAGIASTPVSKLYRIANRVV